MGINRKLFGDTTCINTSGNPHKAKKLYAEQEPDNSVDESAMKLVKNNETVGHLPCEYSRILWYYSARGCDWLQTFICSSKAKINRLKELLKSKIC